MAAARDSNFRFDFHYHIYFFGSAVAARRINVCLARGSTEKCQSQGAFQRLRCQ